MKKYKGYYSTFDEAVKCKSLWQLKEHIENAMGDDFFEYETAAIDEYNIFGRISALHYFSRRDELNDWVRNPNPITSYLSWHSAKEPFKTVARWLLDILGFKAAQDKRINDFVNSVKAINE